MKKKQLADHGSPAGYSIEGIFGGMNHYDDRGQSAGYSIPGILGGSSHYDGSGEFAGYSTPNIIAGSTFHSVSDSDSEDPFDPFRDSGIGEDDGFF